MPSASIKRKRSEPASSVIKSQRKKSLAKAGRNGKITEETDDGNESNDTAEVKNVEDEVAEDDMQIDKEYEEESVTISNESASMKSKEAHKVQRELAKERKAQKPHFDILNRAKKIWERVRLTDLKSEERSKLMQEMMQLITGRVKDIIFKHDASRIIQTCVKYGNSTQRQTIATELKGHYVVLAKSSYGHFIVSKLLHHCPSLRSEILPEFHGQIVKLIRHQFASQVIEDAYVLYSNAQQRFELLEELYGPEFRLFKSQSKAKNLTELLNERPEKRESIMGHLRKLLSAITEKSLIHYAIVHRALLDYMQNADESGRKDMIEQLREQVAEIVHTAEGSRVARLCFLYGSAKDRKILVKSIKPFVNRIAKDDEGHKVILTIFDVVDDTVLVGKNIISELKTDLLELIGNKFSRRIIAYLLVGRSTRYMSKDNINSFVEDDSIRSDTSKKDSETRRQELIAYIADDLIHLVRSNCERLFRDNLSCQILTEVLLFAPGDKTDAYEAIIALIKDMDPDNEEHILRLSWASRSIKALLHGGYWDTSKSAPNVVVNDSKFFNMFVEACGDLLEEFACNYASFVVLAILDSPNNGEATKKVRSILKAASAKIKVAAKDGNKGSELILQTIGK